MLNQLSLPQVTQKVTNAINTTSDSDMTKMFKPDLPDSDIKLLLLIERLLQMKSELKKKKLKAIGMEADLMVRLMAAHQLEREHDETDADEVQDDDVYDEDKNLSQFRKTQATL
ncbi:hypothetical protein FQR65_LT11093 [Abscondita terminalis]|nr:hypothetical protein FQR65_LT11093 [Abscondita terminalis]